MTRVCQRQRRHLWELGILKRLIVSTADGVYPRFLEIAELARSLCHRLAELLVSPQLAELTKYAGPMLSVCECVSLSVWMLTRVELKSQPLYGIHRVL